jgi:hypothetical protein
MKMKMKGKTVLVAVLMCAASVAHATGGSQPTPQVIDQSGSCFNCTTIPSQTINQPQGGQGGAGGNASNTTTVTANPVAYGGGGGNASATGGSVSNSGNSTSNSSASQHQGQTQQQRSNAEEVLRENLEDKEDVSEDVKAQYNELVAKFEVLKKDYEADVDAYETKLAAYNTEVSDWNNRGGAPSDVREDLDARADALKDEQKALEKSAQQLNGLIADINRIGARGNTLVADYNSTVSEYNDRFTESEEFAQGDYTHDAIDIYEFNSDDELTIVLAHELGHALSLSHVDGSSSIMYAHMGKQSLLSGITSEDRAEYVRQCANRGTMPTIVRTIRALFQG